MRYLWITVVATVFLFFIFLRPRYKVFLAFFVMTACFDLAPRQLFKTEIWDVGAILLLISGLHLIFVKAAAKPIRASYLTILMVFTGWLILCAIWSIVIFNYPVLATIKVSRQMIIGYISIFILLRLFRVDPTAFDFLNKTFYCMTFFLLIACIAQYLLNRPILFSLTSKYVGAVRALPIFLPFCLLSLWFIMSKYLSGIKVKYHEMAYGFMTIVVTAITYTRGIYFAVMIIFLSMLLLLTIHKKLAPRKALVFSVLSIICISTLVASGGMNRVVGRTINAFELVTTIRNENNTTTRINQDTFSGRLALMRERFELVYGYNPLFGYGFLHEENVPRTLRNALRYGSVVDTEEYRKKYQRGHPYVLALHSVDIGWGDMVLNSGFIGLLLFVVFVCVYTFSFLTQNRLWRSKRYNLRMALFLQSAALVIVMFNGNPYIEFIQIPGFMIAGYAFHDSLDKKSISIEPSRIA
jgi:hypothetical protein